MDVDVDVDLEAGTGVPGVEGAGVEGPLGDALSGVPRCMNLRFRVPVEIDMVAGSTRLLVNEGALPFGWQWMPIS